MGIKVDQWGNVWDDADAQRLRPAWPHPELDEDKARSPCCRSFVFRAQTPRGDFEWRCGCGRVFPGLHH